MHCCSYHSCLCARCTILGFVALVLVVAGPQMIVDMIKETVSDWTVADTVAKLEEASQRKHEVVTLNFFNLTNGLALQTESPPPKPTFEVVPVRFNYTYERLNSTVLEHGMGYKYVSWSYYDVQSAADAAMEIVQVNPIYIAAMAQFGAPSESVLFAGLASTVLGMLVSDIFAVGVDQLFAPMVAAAAGATDHSTGALSAAMLGLSGLFGHGDLGVGTDLASLTDLKYLQFGAGLLSQAATMSPLATSLADLPLFREQGVCTPVELYAFLNHPSGPLAAGGTLHSLASGLVAAGFTAAAGVPSNATVSLSFSMSIAQAKAFLDTMTFDSMDLIRLSGAFGAALAADPACASEECATLRAALTQPGGPIAMTYGKLELKAETGSFSLCDPKLNTGLAVDASPLTSGQCALLALAYTDYLVNHLGPRFVMGCQLVGGPKADDPLVTGAFTLRADGTGAANSGLITRRTVRELWFGFDDPLLALAGEGVAYHGMATIDIPEPADLLAKFAEETAAPASYSHSYTSGKGKLADRGKILRHPDERRMGSPGYPGYRLSDGKLQGGDFDPEGLHKVEEQPMLEEWPSAFAALRVGLTTSPAEAIDWGPIPKGEPIDLYLTDVRRNMVLRCEDGCPWDKVHGKVYAKRYVVSGTEGEDYQLHEGGVPSSTCGGTVSQQHHDASVAIGMPPAGSPSTCDYAMRYSWLFDVSQATGVPAAVSLAFCGNCDASVRDAISILNATTGEEVHFDADAHGPALWFEPLTGWLVKGKERLQNNWMIERSSLDSPMYANIFQGADDNDDVFVWPYVFANREQGLTTDQADEFAAALYGGYLIAKLVLVVGIGACGLLAATFLYELRFLRTAMTAKTVPERSVAYP